MGRTNEHSHPPDPEKLQAHRVRASMKERARTKQVSVKLNYIFLSVVFGNSINSFLIVRLHPSPWTFPPLSEEGSTL